MRKSKIFTNKELETIEEFKKGNRTDKDGTFANRIKPKIKELIEVWFPKTIELHDLLKK